MLGAMSVINFASENASACYTQRTTVNPGGQQTTDDGHIVSEQDITEFGGSATYEIINQYSPGCRSNYDYDFHAGATKPGWTVLLRDADGNNLNGQTKTFSGSGTFTMYYVVTAVSVENGDILESSPWVHTTDNYNEDNTVYIDTKTTLNIPNMAPEVDLITPNGGERWRGANDITWTATDEEDDNEDLLVRLRYTTNDRDWTLIEKDLPNTGSYSWDTTSFPDNTNYKVQLIVQDSFNKLSYDQSESTFIIDNINPINIVVNAPCGGVTWFGSKTITWSAVDTKLGDENLDITIKYGYGDTWKVIASDEDNDGAYEWDTGEVADRENYKIRVVAENEWDWMKDDTTDEFKVNNEDHLDTDGDGYADSDDAFPNNPDEWLDTDGDGIGNNADDDDDNDGYLDEYELNCGSNPLDPESMPDYDGDGIDNNNDLDNDNDGFDDAMEEELGMDPYDSTDFPDTIINVVLECPCDLLITDKYYKRLGYENGQLFGEIPGGLQTSDDGSKETYTLYDPENLKYTVKGNREGEYDLTIDRIENGLTTTVEVQDISISMGEKNRYTIDWAKAANNRDDAVTIEIDINGDGEYESSVKTGIPVTMDDLRDTDDDNIIDILDTDDDGDGYPDRTEIAEGSDPLDADSIPDDFDGDFIPDSIDEDFDGDGVDNYEDAYPEDGDRYEEVDTSKPAATTGNKNEDRKGAIGMGKIGSLDTAYLILLVIVGIIFCTNAGLIVVLKRKTATKSEERYESPEEKHAEVVFEPVVFAKDDYDF